MEIREYKSYNSDEITRLYESVGWVYYAEHPDMLRQAYENSICIFGASKNGQLIGIIRAVGDGASIVFIQDIIVLPEYQRRGIGTALLKAVIERYPSVYQMELLTDNTERTVSFYQSVGFRPASELGCLAFVRMQ